MNKGLVRSPSKFIGARRSGCANENIVSPVRGARVIHLPHRYYLDTGQQLTANQENKRLFRRMAVVDTSQKWSTPSPYRMTGADRSC
jgi:hypothetical protein